MRCLFASMVLAIALPAAAGLPPDPVHLSGAASDVGLTGDWDSSSGLVAEDHAGDYRVDLQADYACGHATLEVPGHNDQKDLPKLTLTATGVSLAGSQKTLRSVTIRASRGSVTVCGKLRVYRDDDDNEVIEFALYKEGATPAFQTTSAAIDGSVHLTLVWDSEQETATLSFGATDYSPDLSEPATADVNLCRVELQGNTYLGPTPSIESFDAAYEESP